MGLKRRQEQRYASCIACGSKVDAVHQAYALFFVQVWNPRLQTSQSISEHTDIKTAAGLDRSRGIIQKRIAASKKHHEAHTAHPPSLVKKIFGIGPSDGVWPPSRLIFPLSPFAVCWTAITCFFLLYTAVVTPAVIAFHWLDEECAKIPVSGMHIQQAHCCWHQPSACP